jgi:Tol biopolymer transport system component
MRDSGGGQRKLGSSPGIEGWISWSPDSKRIVYMSAVSDRVAEPPPVAAPAPGPGDAAPGRTSGNEHDIFIRDIASGQPIRLTDAPGTDGGPSWSPDGSTIVFHSERSGDLEIWSIPASGGDAIQLTHAPGYDLSPSWTPDGSRVTFASDRDGDYGIWSMAPDGSDVRKLTDLEGDEWMPGWSPDGQTMSFMCATGGSGEVCTMDVRTRVVTRHTDDDRFDTQLSSEPWSADGKTLVYSSRLLLPDEVADKGDVFDVARLLLAIVALAAVLLTAWHLGLWATGTAFVVFALPVALVAAVTDELRFLPAIALAGVALEVVTRLLKPWTGGRRRVRAIAVAAPAAWIAGYFATLAVGDDLRWGVELSVGVAICCGAIGLLLVQLILTPSDVDPG